MDLHLSEKTAVVTGASKGIGLAITQHWWTRVPTSWPDHAAAGPDSPRWRRRGK